MKTAALTAACTECGAKAVIDDADILQSIKLFGETIGIAFQIRGDVLDYEANDSLRQFVHYTTSRK